MSKNALVKTIAIVLIAIGLLIPLTMIRALVEERSRFRSQARQDIASSWTGAQTVLGPVLQVPRDFAGPANADQFEECHFLLPDSLVVQSSLRTESRRRGLYSVPVYFTQLRISGEFDLPELVGPTGIEGGPFDLAAASVGVSVSDIRGIAGDPEFSWDGQSGDFLPGSGIPGSPEGMRAAVDLSDSGTPARYPFTMVIELHGMERLQFSPVGKNTRVHLDAEWPHPSFVGKYLPVEREIGAERFSAEWRVSHLAGGAGQILDELNFGRSERLANSAFGVALINPVDIYQQATRSVKYGSMFVLLTFTAFFLVELTRQLQLHPMQYLLVGLALTIFYLLLLSLSEHMPFGVAYLVAAVACVGLIGIYMSAVLGQVSNGFGVGAILGGLYGMLYAILISEDNALLMGSLLLFLALAAVMYLTRRIDWYGIAGEITAGKTPLSAGGDG